MVAVLEIIYPNADKVRLDLEQEMRRGGLFACATGAHELEPFAPVELRLVVGDYRFCAQTRLTTASAEFMCVEIPAEVPELVAKWLPEVGAAQSPAVENKIARLFAAAAQSVEAESAPTFDVELASDPALPVAEPATEVTAVEDEAIVASEVEADAEATVAVSASHADDSPGGAPSDPYSDVGTRPLTLDKKIAMLSVGEKVQLALHSGREERAQLFKDRAGVVQASLVRNVKVSIDEVVALARAPHLAADAAEVMQQHRIFGHSSQIAAALVRNPRTPTPIAMEMIERLSLTDLRVIAKGNGVRANIAQAARKRLLAL